jgi:hypothetical protein
MACGTCGITGHNKRTCKGATATAKAEPKAVAKAIPIVKVKGKTMKEDKHESAAPLAEDILFFFRSMKGGGREENGANNDKREVVLKAVLKEEHYRESDEYGCYWVLLRDRLLEAAREICPEGGELLKMEHKGGRKWNYDYQFTYSGGQVVKVEYKYGESSIQSLPQFYQKETNAGFLPGFAEAYYDSRVSSHPLYGEGSVGVAVPGRVAYMKEVYKNESKNAYFVRLKEKTKADKEFYKQLNEGVATPFLKEWLGKNYRNVDCGMLGELLKKSQAGKVYLLWKDGEFAVERIEDREFESLSLVGVGPKGNTIIIRSGSGAYRFHMLLRWKNGIGLLKPAWQISLKAGDGAEDGAEAEE